MAEGKRRSLLYLPASSERMIEKAGSRGADVLVLDLEDGVHPDRKDEARGRVAALYRDVDFGGSEVFVRANALDTPWGEKDLSMLGELRPEGVVLPKVEDPAVAESVGGRLSGVPLFFMIETARGVLAAESLARTRGVEGLLFGAADYRESVRAERSADEQEIFHARMAVLLAARSAGIEAFDTPWFDYRDLEGLEASARRARLLGYDGKTAIHPGQIEPIHRIFSPTPAEIERARGIVEVMEKALSEGRSVATLGGEMVEALHLRGARRVLKRGGLAEAPPETTGGKD